MIQAADFQFVQKHLTQAGIVVLAGVNQNLLTMFIEQRNNTAQADDLGTCAENSKKFHLFFFYSGDISTAILARRQVPRSWPSTMEGSSQSSHGMWRN